MSFVGSLAALGTSLASSALIGTGIGTAAGAAGAAGTAGLLGAGATSALASGLGAIGAGAVTGAGLGGITSAATGQDVGEGMGMGAMTGAIGGGLSAGLGAMAPAATGSTEAALQTAGTSTSQVAANSSPILGNVGLDTATSAFNNASAMPTALQSTGTNMAAVNSASSPLYGNIGVNAVDKGITQLAMNSPTPVTTMSEKIGAYAAANPGTIGTIGSLAATPLVSGAFAPDQQEAPGIQYPNIDPNKFKYSQPQWSVYQPKYYAGGGGITDLDAGNGIPSVQMMASGGFTGRLMDNVGNSVLDPVVKTVTGWDDPSEIPLIGGLFNKPESAPQMATLTPEEKQKLMAMIEAKQLGQVQPVQNMARGGISDLGGYSDGGRLLKGPGDGVSDDIPAQIGNKQPARLADGEFVIPARIVSELGNGSTDAGARRLYQMMDRINSGRAKTTKKGKFAEDTKADKHLPA
jgi:hypothetical protein